MENVPNARIPSNLRSMKRRTFVKNMALTSATLPFAMNGFSMQAVTKKLFNYNKSAEDRVLVLVRLNGGNDGLNTLIPLDQYANLVVQRPQVIVPEASVLSIAADNGLHPSMTGMHSLYTEGKLAIIQNVGYPQQNRSHFRSMDIWSVGQTDPTETRGWLGRYMDTKYPNFPVDYPNSSYPDPFAISMGYDVSLTCQGLMANFSQAINDPSATVNLPVNAVVNDGTYYGSHMEYISNMIDQTNAYGAEINAAYNQGNNLSTMYNTSNDLALQLRQVAKLISGGLQAKVYIVNQEGFDTHNAQVDENDKTQGAHADLLKIVSDAITAFMDDIRLLGLSQRVAGITFSEFGRQIASNASNGTDHGDAAPLFVFGECVSSQLIGPNPTIPNQQIPQAGVTMQIDFRDVYASLLKDWFMVPENEIQQLFDIPVTCFPILSACNLGTNEIENTRDELLVFPNPASTQTTVRFKADGGNYSIKITDLNGKIIKEIFEGNLSTEEHLIPLDLSGISEGMYVVKVHSNTQSNSVRFTKIR